MRPPFRHDFKNTLTPHPTRFESNTGPGPHLALGHHDPASAVKFQFHHYSIFVLFFNTTKVLSLLYSERS